MLIKKEGKAQIFHHCELCKLYKSNKHNDQTCLEYGIIVGFRSVIRIYRICNVITFLKFDEKRSFITLSCAMCKLYKFKEQNDQTCLVYGITVGFRIVI